MTCPSDLKLETYLVAPRESGIERHLASCAPCQALIAHMQRLGEVFDGEIYPATIDAVVRAAQTDVESVQRARSTASVPCRFPWWALVPLAAAAAVLLVLASRVIPARSTLDLSVYVDARDGARPLHDGAIVPANAALRFQVRPGSPCNLWVLSVDPEGDIVRLYPPKGDPALERQVHPAERQDLPTRAVLDGRAGPQRIFAVCTTSPVPWNTVKSAAAEKLGKGEEAVRAYRSIPGLPPGATQWTLLVEKRS